MSKAAISLISFYQKFLSFDKGLLMFLAPGGACKYPTTCSEYTKNMVMRFGVVKGLLLGLKRIWRCR